MLLPLTQVLLLEQERLARAGGRLPSIKRQAVRFHFHGQILVLETATTTAAWMSPPARAVRGRLSVIQPGLQLRAEVMEVEMERLLFQLRPTPDLPGTEQLR